VLLIVGVALVAFGAVVLLLFPERPGGRIAWQGVEVSSVGAGLPLIVVGVVAIAAGGSDRLRADAGGSRSETRAAATDATATGCLERYFEGIPATRLDTLEEGVHDYDAIRANEPKAGPLGLTLTELARPIGAVRIVFLPANAIFKVESVVDAACRPVEDFANESRPGNDKHTLQNFDAMRLHLGDRWYTLGVGASATLRFNFFHVEP
jgi:hypothetical protein